MTDSAVQGPGTAASPRCEPEPLNDAEEGYLAGQLQSVAALAQLYTGDDADLPAIETLDATWNAWQRDTEPGRMDAPGFVAAVSAALGQHLARELGLRWAIITDEVGTDLGLYGEDAELSLFPTGMVAKHAGELDSPVSRLYATTVAAVRSVLR